MIERYSTGIIAGAALTGETGPGSTVGGFVVGGATYLGVAYGVTRIMDEQIWPGFNRVYFSNFFR